MKKYFIYAASALALAGCSSDDFIGNSNGSEQGANDVAINFSGNAGKITRANKSGSDAATALNNQFVVFGYKTTNNGTSTVYNHYNVKWQEGTANQTASNTNDWEYVGIDKNTLNNVEGATQTIKYWDYSTKQYDFIAFSFGKAQQGTGENEVEASTVSTTPSYTLKGKVTELVKCFIADRVTAKPTVTDKKTNKLIAYKDVVGFNFRSLATKVKMGIYETIPGYSVKDVKFYTKNDDTTPGEDAALYAAKATIPGDDATGKMTITFGDNDETQNPSPTNYNQAFAKWEAEEANTNTSVLKFSKDNYPLQLKAAESKEEAVNKYIGRSISETSYTKDYKTILPVKAGALTLKVDYTLVSTDGSGENIKVTGATATIPEVYTNWEPNYAYTYIFKISDKTNGSTGGGEQGLYPITFDAVVTETEEGKQETITAVEDPSITTYAKGAINNEYKSKSNIYVSVTDKDLNLTTSEGKTANCALYTVTTSGSFKATEANVALCLEKGTESTEGTNNETVVKTLKEGTNSITVKTQAGLSIVNEIAADDAANGNAISGNFAKFTPQGAGNYVFEYTKTTTTGEEGNTTTKTNKYYKVIVVEQAQE